LRPLQQLLTRWRRGLALLGLCSVALSCEGRLFALLPSRPALAPQQACSPAAHSGECAAHHSCVGGTCFVVQALPAACSAAQPGGVCAGGAACVQGACVAIASSSLCSAALPQGLCPGGQRCMEGLCYVDDGTLLCAPEAPLGACPAGLSCVMGRCEEFVSACSDANPHGRCPTWQRCAAGLCIGPAAPDACSVDLPAGRCPAAELCRSGVCTPVDLAQACTPQQPQGQCYAMARCEGGACVARINDRHAACSAAHPEGVCAAAQSCRGGVCVAQPVVQDVAGDADIPAAAAVLPASSAPGLPCDAAHPQGPCLSAAQTCVDGRCTAPTCSPAHSDGLCFGHSVCRAGRCEAPDCSPQWPMGHCAVAGTVCQAGHCVQPACDRAHLQGACPASVCTAAPFNGCAHPQPAVCCDASLAAVTGCQLGRCAPAACGPQALHGACPGQQLCTDGRCTAAPCSPFFPLGLCPGHSEVCTQGRCSRVGCAQAADPQAHCWPQVCDLQRSRCVAPPCSPAHPEGFCTLGERCCSPAVGSGPGADPRCHTAGQCYVPSCSPRYLGGACPQGQVCSGGACQTPPCSSAFVEGRCAAESRCEAGVCRRLPCAESAGHGVCPPQTTCLPGDTGGFACAAPLCGDALPWGRCPPGQRCVAQGPAFAQHFACRTPHCSPTAPGGACPDPAAPLCVEGRCVAAACSPMAPDGVCPRSQSCLAGICLPLACELADPRDGGACPASLTCCTLALQAAALCPQVNTCVAARCSPQFPDGTCDAPGEVCVTSQDLLFSASRSGPTASHSGPTASHSAPAVRRTLLSAAWQARFQAGAQTACVPLCSPTQPQGLCPQGHACVEGACSHACAGDQDCDSIADGDEGLGAAVDTDGDGAPDAVDRDSDNDGLPDAVEAGDALLQTPPLRSSATGPQNFRTLDADGDGIADALEAGPQPQAPRDSDGDGVADYLDTDSDNDGILDRCEASSATGILCGARPLIVDAHALSCADGDGVPDYLDTDSDADGISDALEARVDPLDASSLQPQGVDHDGDGVPDYRDADSDNDGIFDGDEDRNGNGQVDCQTDARGLPVPDLRQALSVPQVSAAPELQQLAQSALPAPWSVPAAFSTPLQAQTQTQAQAQAQPGARCLPQETDRLAVDTDNNGLPDAEDGIFNTCARAQRKPVNVFYLRQVGTALALEPAFTQALPWPAGPADHLIASQQGAVAAGTALNAASGLRFDAPQSSDGSAAVSGLLLARAPLSAGLEGAAFSQQLVRRAAADRRRVQQAPGVVELLQMSARLEAPTAGGISELTQLQIETRRSMLPQQLRDLLAQAFSEVPNVAGSQAGRAANSAAAGAVGRAAARAATRGPTGQGSPAPTRNFTVLWQTTAWRSGTVAVLLAVLPTGESSDDPHSFRYRSRCAKAGSAADCAARPGCNFQHAACTARADYQLPLFYAQNIAGGGALSPLGHGLQSVCQAMVQAHGKLDILWTVDNSPSMGPKIAQVSQAAALFFPLLDSSEVDYRVAQTTTSVGGALPPEALTAASLPPDDDSPIGVGDVPPGSRGTLRGAFTGAIAGQPAPGVGPLADRSVRYACAEGCAAQACERLQSLGACRRDAACQVVDDRCATRCCPACRSSQDVLQSPSCYFASRLPDDRGEASEYGLLMTQWALQRAVTAASPQQRLRPDATRVAVLLSDEEDCLLKDGPGSLDPTRPWGPPPGGVAGDGRCGGGQFTGGITGYQDPQRQATVQALAAQLQGLQVSLYGLVGDAADPSAAPAAATSLPPQRLHNGGCVHRSLHYCAEAGQGAIDVAAQTGGGWGSLCAPDRFGAIEPIVLSALAKASPYRLQAPGHLGAAASAAQPIAATVQVAVQVCQQAHEYPLCGSGTVLRRVPRSRDDGFDYDPLSGTLSLFGRARPAHLGSITVHYDSWQARPENAGGAMQSACACIDQRGDACLCPGGRACGLQPAQNPEKNSSADLPPVWTDACAQHATAAACQASAGCAFNLANGGFCQATGRCEADAHCGAGCGQGEICDPVQGLCVCDPGCGTGCRRGSVCDPSSRTYRCQTLQGDACAASPGCVYDGLRQACLSTTCGTCICDSRCGDACSPLQRCDPDPASPTCGQCVCDTACGGRCSGQEVCDARLDSPSCGLCLPRGCGPCPPGSVCDRARGACVCDPGCQHVAVGPGQRCDTDLGSPTCGQPVCDTSCHGGCGPGQVCAQEGPACGLCQLDTSCATTGPCAPDCAGLSPKECASHLGCIRKAGGCFPQICRRCDPSQGVCAVDPLCLDCGCTESEICDPLAGACVCDTTCGAGSGSGDGPGSDSSSSSGNGSGGSSGGGCGPAQRCDHALDSPTCGTCVCDTQCGHGCLAGQRCDSGPGSSTCGLCLLAASGEVSCQPPTVYDPRTGVCVTPPGCGLCPQGSTCNPVSGQCEPLSGF
jgi:hypothetical protein